MSKFIDTFGHGYKRRFVALDKSDNGSLFVCGIFNSYEKALGHIMMNIDEFSESYNEKEGDVFEVGKLKHGEYYDSITVKFQQTSWDKPHMEVYYIVEHKKRKKKWDRPKEKHDGTKKRKNDESGLH